MKKISEQQIQAVLATLENNNVGVKEFIAIQNMFNQLPLVEEEKKEDKKDK